MDYPAAIGAGLIGGAVTSVILYMGIAMMPGQIKMDLFYLLGSMTFRRKVMVYLGGAMAYAAMSIEFALIYVGVFEWVDIESALAAWGLLFGFVHYLVVGMALGMMPMMHPPIKTGEIQAPGAFALAYPAGTVTGFLMLHLLYGVLVGALYTAFRGV